MSPKRLRPHGRQTHRSRAGHGGQDRGGGGCAARSGFRHHRAHGCGRRARLRRRGRAGRGPMPRRARMSSSSRRRRRWNRSPQSPAPWTGRPCSTGPFGGRSPVPGRRPSAAAHRYRRRQKSRGSAINSCSAQTRFFAVTRTLADLYGEVRRNGTYAALADRMTGFDEFNDIVGFTEVAELDRRYRGAEAG